MIIKPRGMVRMSDNEKAILVMFDRRLTDDEFRAFHDQPIAITEEPGSREQYSDMREIPTRMLASRVVGSLIETKGNLNQYSEIIEMLIRELRGEPRPSPTEDIARPPDKT